MKQIISIMLFCAISVSMANGNNLDLRDSIQTIKSEQVKLAGELKQLKSKQENSDLALAQLHDSLEIQKAYADSLHAKLVKLQISQESDRTTFSGQIEETNSSLKTNNDKLNTRSIVATVIGFVLLLVIAIVGLLLRKRINKGTSSIDEVRKAQDALKEAQTKMQEESIKLDNQLLAVASQQIAAATQQPVGKDAEPDHSLAKKVADEIVRIELNLSRMDSSIKGHKQLAKAVQRIKDNFNANGYEIVDMLGKPYNEGMKVVANFVADENLEEGAQIITGITKPQINYNGQMIQSAQITVSQNI